MALGAAVRQRRRRIPILAVFSVWRWTRCVDHPG